VTHTPTLLSRDELKNLLKTIGLARRDSELYTSQRRKFLEVLAMAEQLAIIAQKITKRRTVTLLDCACGKGYLAFMLNHVMTHKLGRSTYFIGVDKNPYLISKCKEAQRLLGFNNMEFHVASIINLHLDKKPDITYCLHACDTATDETIAKGIVANSRFIVAVPCCHREIGLQMRFHPLKPMTQFPKIKERLSSLVTDAMRALILGAAGYKVEIFEFISSKVTPKNLVLRSEKMWCENPNSLNQYWQLRHLFDVKPKVEEHLTWLRPNNR